MQNYAGIASALLTDLGELGAGEFLTSDMPIQAIHAQVLRKSFFKKLAPEDEPSPAAIEKALKKFKVINSGCRVKFDPIGVSQIEDLLLQKTRDEFRRILGFDYSGEANFDLDFMRMNIAGGPGASLGCDSSNFYTKFFQSRITMTHPHLMALYRAAISESDSWASAERQRDMEFGHEIVQGNRLFFVKKDSEIARTCCTEPFLNMMFQKSLGAFIESRMLKHLGLTLSVQADHNRKLCRIGSIDGSFGTIDSVSASDSIGNDLVQWLSKGTGLDGWFRLFRCETATLPDGSVEELSMVSTMGNGFTFPLQTLIFACAVRAVYWLKDLNSSSCSEHYGVFGDDIIVRREAYDAVVSLLTRLGFTVNDLKSYNTGSFRESCGHDFYAGTFVRGVYVKTLETNSDVYSAINRLVRWSALSEIPLPKTLGLLRRMVRNYPVPYSEADHVGIKTPFRYTKPKVDNSYWFAYRKLIIKSQRRKVPVDRSESKELGYASFNKHGWALAFLGGYARSVDTAPYDDNVIPGLDTRVLTIPDAYLGVREDRGVRFTKVVHDSIPFWDWEGVSRGQPTSSIGAWERAYTNSFGVFP